MLRLRIRKILIEEKKLLPIPQFRMVPMSSTGQFSSRRLLFGHSGIIRVKEFSSPKSKLPYQEIQKSDSFSWKLLSLWLFWSPSERNIAGQFMLVHLLLFPLPLAMLALLFHVFGAWSPLPANLHGFHFLVPF